MFVLVAVTRFLRASLLSRVDIRLVHRLGRCWVRLVNRWSRFREQSDRHRCTVMLRGARVVVPCTWTRALSARAAWSGSRPNLLDSLPTTGSKVSLSNLNHLELHSRSYLGLVREMAYSQSTMSFLVLQVLEMSAQSQKSVLNGSEAYHAKLPR